MTAGWSKGAMDAFHTTLCIMQTEIKAVMLRRGGQRMALNAVSQCATDKSSCIGAAA